MNAAEPLSIQGHVDAAFSGMRMTPALQDLKEEVRANLTARVSELAGQGIDLQSATGQAIDELGDLSQLIRDVADERPDPHIVRVRPRPSFVVSTVALSIVLVAGAVVVGLAAGRVVGLGYGILAAIAGGLAGGAITFSSLRQETTAHYPSPPTRSALYGLATGVGLAGVGLVVVAVGRWPDAPVVGVGAASVLLGALGLVALGASQTNRTKEWALAAAAEQRGADRFSQDPAAAARFGIYLITIWIVAIAAFLALSFTVGFVWSWLALVAGLAASFILLARMLFPPNSPPDEARRP